MSGVLHALIGRKDKVPELLVAGHGPMAAARAPHSHSSIWSFSSKPPFLDILQSVSNIDVFAHPRSRPPSQLSFPAHHPRSLKSSHWEGQSHRNSCNILIASEGIGKSTLNFPFLTQPNGQHVLSFAASEILILTGGRITDLSTSHALSSRLHATSESTTMGEPSRQLHPLLSPTSFGASSR